MVWRLFVTGLPCSAIDELLSLPPGSARRHVVGRWADEKMGRERSL
jgi:hypothetical protein